MTCSLIYRWGSVEVYGVDSPSEVIGRIDERGVESDVGLLRGDVQRQAREAWCRMHGWEISVVDGDLVLEVDGEPPERMPECVAALVEQLDAARRGPVVDVPEDWVLLTVAEWGSTLDRIAALEAWRARREDDGR